MCLRQPGRPASMISLDPNSPKFQDVATPALVIDCGALQANIASMQETAARAGIFLRPHAKTHKSLEIAHRQLAAGAIGIACATVAEAEALASGGIDNLLVTAPTIGGNKLARLVALQRRSPLTVTVDHLAQVDGFQALLTAADPPLAVLVDIDVGQKRTGVTSTEAVVELARHISSRPQLRFAGIQGFAGQAQHIHNAENRRDAAAMAAAILADARDALKAAGFAVGIVSGSGTGTSEYDFSDTPYTELQVGSYIFMDADYGRVVKTDGSRLPFRNSLFVLATVVSANLPGQFTVDAGTKALAFNGPAPDRIIGAPQGSTYSFAGDEHGIIALPSGTAAPALGARVLLGATHCDPTVNLHAAYHVADRDGSLALWRVTGRHGAAQSTAPPH